MGILDCFKRGAQVRYNWNKENSVDTSAKCLNYENEKTKTIEKPAIEYLMDLDTLDETIKRNVEYMVKKETEYSVCEKLFLLHAWQSAYNYTYCIFAKIKNQLISIYPKSLKNGIIGVGCSDRFTFDEFYSLEKEEFFRKLYHMKNYEVVIVEKFKENIWESMMRIFPEYTSRKTSRMAIFEKYLSYSLDNFVGAGNYSNSGMLYKMLKPISPVKEGMMEFQCWKVINRGKDNETRDLVNTYCFASFPQTEDEFASYVQRLFNKEVDNALMSIPHRTVLIDNRDSINCGSMLFEGDFRALHIYKSTTDTSYIALKTYSVYNGRSQEGGRMEGYTFNKIIQIPAEQYNWTDEELVAEYKRYFK